MTIPPHGPTSGTAGTGEDPTQVSIPTPAAGSYPPPPQWPVTSEPSGWQQYDRPAAAPPQNPAWRRWAIPAGIVVVVLGAAAAIAVNYSKDNSKSTVPIASQTVASVESATTTSATSTTSETSPPPAPPAPPPPPVVASGAVNTLLLTPATINTVMGTTNLVAPPNETYSRALRPGTFTPQECAGAFLPGEENTYSALNGGPNGIAVQAIHEAVRPRSHNVLQVVSTFADADAARKFFDQRVADWASCDGKIVTLRNEDGSADKARIGPTSVKEDINYLTVTNPDPAADGMVCQRAITTISNVVVDTRTCARDITTQAIDMARQIRQGVH
ncbi:Serine/threonine-protein kinase PknH [Mycobacteroides salmoniphilum]|uniref:Serine/threonine-protein kinase PknH n=2 Tax=Mycobacteroides salmoniphilum TaxID=404941 RepID=A0A4R8S442_9MYCO|nr:Serine/threonine-protein kinase PknH [Mycobacteroides salmoniphilum]